MGNTAFTLTGALTLTALAFIQNVTFSMVSRSRNRSSMTYHLLASIGSNTIWFLTFRSLVLADMTWTLLPFYVVGTVLGSLSGTTVSMKIESWLGATSDDHIKSKKPEPEMERLKERVAKLEANQRTAPFSPVATT